MNRLRLPLLLLVFTSASCAAPIFLAGFGAAVGIWTYDDFSDDRGEILLNAPADRVFATAQAVARERQVTDLQTMPGTLRVEWTEDRTKVAVQVLLMPDSPEFSTLKVYASELGVRGRGELAKEIAEAIADRL
jgi:hypothetical protein